MYLNCKTNFSFKYGTWKTEELVMAAAYAGVGSLALTNINNTSDTWDFVRFCEREKIKPIGGAEIRNGNKLLYILIAKNNKGLAWINEFISTHLCNGKPFDTDIHGYPDFQFFEGFVIYPLTAKSTDQLFPNEFIGIRASEINKLFGKVTSGLKQKLVVLQPVCFQDKNYYNLHRLMRSIHSNCLLTKLDPEAICATDEWLVPVADLLDTFKNHPYIISNTFWLMEQYELKMDFHTDKTKQFYGASLYEDRLQLDQLAQEGFLKRYSSSNVLAKKRLERELHIIDSMNFNAVFLRTWDMVRYAKSRGFYHVGRGSGANSIVAYCLEITDVDPAELNLYFERFLNPERMSPPDFDIDFSWLDRDEMIAYLFRRYGEKHVSLLGTYTTFKEDSIYRELGKVFGLPKEEIDNLGDEPLPVDDIHRLILRYGKMMAAYPQRMSIHAGGILISDELIYNYTSCFMPPKGFMTSHIDMYVAESIGLHKLDVLSQRGLGHIKECIRLVKENKGVDIDISKVHEFKNDPNVRRQIREVNTIGCFYIESPAMRQLLGKLKCDDYNTLVSASSIIRPGVSSSGMMREFITRYHEPQKVIYLHPLFEEHLSSTFGVMVFQEDVIKIAHYYAGMSLGKADIMRRAMSGKYKTDNEFRMIREDFYTGASALGRPVDLTAEIWRQMESFAGYSFCKAHSASFALESFQGLYLKCYHPMEFMVAVINNFGGFYPTALYFYELQKSGATIHLPCINNSEEQTNINGIDVYTGFQHVRDLRQQFIRQIVEERRINGHYMHLQDFVERLAPSKEQLNILVSVGAFRFTGTSKKKLLWEANYLQTKMALQDTRHTLFPETVVKFELPDLSEDPLGHLYDQMEHFGFLLTNPFELAADDPAKYQVARDMKAMLHQQITMLLYYIAYKHVPTKNDQAMFFGTFIDHNLDWVDTVHFPEAARKYPIRRDGFYKVTGKVVEDFSVCSLEVNWMTRIGYKQLKYER